MLSTDPYADYLRSARQLTGARSVSLLLAPRGDESSSALLLHAGMAPQVPELKDIQSAERFLAATGLDQAETLKAGHGALLKCYKSSDPKARLCFISLQVLTLLLEHEHHAERQIERRSVFSPGCEARPRPSYSHMGTEVPLVTSPILRSPL